MFVHTSILGEFNSFVFKYSICSADLHGYLVHVPCEPERIDEIMREKYPGNYMISNNKGYIRAEKTNYLLGKLVWKLAIVSPLSPLLHMSMSFLLVIPLFLSD